MSKVSYFPIVCLDKKVKNNTTAFISIKVISDWHPTLDTSVMTFIRLVYFMPN